MSVSAAKCAALAEKIARIAGGMERHVYTAHRSSSYRLLKGTMITKYATYTYSPRRLGAAERLIHLMEQAWAIHLPNVNLEDALQRLESGQMNSPGSTTAEKHEVNEIQPLISGSTAASTEQPPETSPAEASNAEDYEFDESQDFDNTTDGMGFLVAEPGKAGYMGPQSGVAAVKFLQSLHLYAPFPSTSMTSLDESDARSLPVASTADINRYMNDYFRIYHTAYPILHEGTFRARVSGI